MAKRFEARRQLEHLITSGLAQVGGDSVREFAEALVAQMQSPEERAAEEEREVEGTLMSLKAMAGVLPKGKPHAV